MGFPETTVLIKRLRLLMRFAEGMVRQRAEAEKEKGITVERFSVISIFQSLQVESCRGALPCLLVSWHLPAVLGPPPILARIPRFTQDCFYILESGVFNSEIIKLKLSRLTKVIQLLRE
jgi:hypothetical protein